MPGRQCFDLLMIRTYAILRHYRGGYFFLEAFVAMMLVAVVLGGTLTALSNAISISEASKRHLSRLILCETAMETLRHQWFQSPDPYTEIFMHIDEDEVLGEPLGSIGWRELRFRRRETNDSVPPWPAALQEKYFGQYRLQILLTQREEPSVPGEPAKERDLGDMVKPGTLFRLQVRVRSAQDEEFVSLVTILPLSGVPDGS